MAAGVMTVPSDDGASDAGREALPIPSTVSCDEESDFCEEQLAADQVRCGQMYEIDG